MERSFVYQLTYFRYLISLKNRKGRVLSFADVQHYQRIVGALAETIGLMERVDEAIEEHGGWPLA